MNIFLRYVNFNVKCQNTFCLALPLLILPEFAPSCVIFTRYPALPLPDSFIILAISCQTHIIFINIAFNILRYDFGATHSLLASKIYQTIEMELPGRLCPQLRTYFETRNQVGEALFIPSFLSQTVYYHIWSKI